MNAKQLQNSKQLLAIIDAKIAKNEDPLVLDSWVQPCGTYGCILGDYVIENFPDLVETDEHPQITIKCDQLDSNFQREFGFCNYNEDDTIDVIGTSYYGTLKQRRDYVAKIIEEGERNAT